MNHGPLKPLRDQFIAGVGGFQRWPHPDGYLETVSNRHDVRRKGALAGTAPQLPNDNNGIWEDEVWSYAPTLTAVLESSSDARLPPPCLLLVLMRLLLLGVFERMELMGRGGMPVGEPGGDIAMAP